MPKVYARKLGADAAHLLYPLVSWEEAELLLKILAEKMNEGDSLVVCFDLHKDPRILNTTYNDAAGANARFNLNMLARKSFEN